MPRYPVPDLPAPPAVDDALAEEFLAQAGQRVFGVVDLLVEVVDLLQGGHPDLGVELEVVAQPRRACLLRPYPQEIRVQRLFLYDGRSATTRRRPPRGARSGSRSRGTRSTPPTASIRRGGT